ncbi:hypothetical protein [Maritalea myrionectae]|uniref:hypothetical protein n=1 Tax=Maritalea myrionectae TaxID=454601 RepID=UPI000419594B|nr:hypothetical protein [Maritalea myrionectae]
MRFLKQFFKSSNNEHISKQDAQQTFRQFAQNLMAMKARRRSPRLRKVVSH